MALGNDPSSLGRARPVSPDPTRVGKGDSRCETQRNATQGVPFLVWSLSKLLTSEAQLQSSTLYDQIAYLWVVLL